MGRAAKRSLRGRPLKGGLVSSFRGGDYGRVKFRIERI